MVEDDWRRFRMYVEECIMDGENVVTADGYTTGHSRWGDIAEETLVLVWFDKNSPLSPSTITELAGIAKEFKQDAIAYSVSVTNFIEGA